MDSVHTVVDSGSMTTRNNRSKPTGLTALRGWFTGPGGMQVLRSTLAVVAIGLVTGIQAKNARGDLRPELVLSGGQHPEAEAQAHDTLQRIGCWGFNTVSGRAYRFGGQGQENIDEIPGTRGTWLASAHKIHEPRVGRFLSIDPLTAEYPHNSPYAFSENRVIDGVELEGLEVNLVNGGTGQVTGGPLADPQKFADENPSQVQPVPGAGQTTGPSLYIPLPPNSAKAATATSPTQTNEGALFSAYAQASFRKKITTPFSTTTVVPVAGVKVSTDGGIEAITPLDGYVQKKFKAGGLNLEGRIYPKPGSESDGSSARGLVGVLPILKKVPVLDRGAAAASRFGFDIQLDMRVTLGAWGMPTDFELGARIKWDKDLPASIPYVGRLNAEGAAGFMINIY